MQSRRVRGVGMAEVNDSQRFPFEMEAISIENLRRHQLRRKLSGKARFPEGPDKLGFDLVLNGRNDRCGGDRFGMGESVEQELQTEVMVTMGVGDVNRDKTLAALDDPIQQLLRVLRGQKRINEYGIT